MNVGYKHTPYNCKSSGLIVNHFFLKSTIQLNFLAMGLRILLQRRPRLLWGANWYSMQSYQCTQDHVHEMHLATIKTQRALLCL